VSRIFGHGDLRLYLLKLLDEAPRHGYELITQLEERFLGLYSPSPGTIYPRLAALEQEGLIEVVQEQEGRKVYRLTPKGAEELHARSEELKAIGQRVATSAREVSRQIRDEVRSSIRDLRREIKDAAREVRRDERRETRARVARSVVDEAVAEARAAVKEVRDEARAAVRDATASVRTAKGDVKGVLRSLQDDLDAFVTDVLAAARRHGIDKDRLSALRDALRDARASIVEALEGDSDDQSSESSAERERRGTC
jgi:DNA-binding PadR family transcriptional regulator